MKSTTTDKIINPIERSPNALSKITNGQFQARTIWIQPSSLMVKNKNEILAWNPDFSNHHVKVIAGTATQKDKIVNDPDTICWVMTAEAFAKYGADMFQKYPDILQIICDEPHLYYRGFLSKRTQKFVQTVPKHCRINFLTATPTPRGKLISAYIYTHMIQQDYYGTYDFFLRTHAEFDEFQGISHWKNHDILKKFLLNYSICWTTRDMYGDVEEFIVRDMLPIGKEVAKIYNDFADLGIAEIKETVMEAKTGGTNALRIRQILAHPHHIELPVDWDSKGKPIRYSPVCISDKPTPKLERLLEYAEEGEPLVVFGTFTEEINKIAEYLGSKKLRVGVIHGQVSQAKRNWVDQEFRKGNLDVVVCSALTAGVGFNWGHVNTVIFHSLNYGDDDFLQACARAKRGIRNEALRIVLLEYEDSADQLMVWAVHHNSRSSNSANPDNPIIHFPKPSGGNDDLLKNLGLGLSMGA